MTPQKPPDREGLDFAAFLVTNLGGDNAELTRLLGDAAEAVRTTGKAATIKYELTVRPAGKNSRNAYAVTGSVSAKLPALPRESVILFADDKGNLFDHNPKQPALFAPPLPEGKPQE